MIEIIDASELLEAYDETLKKYREAVLKMRKRQRERLLKTAIGLLRRLKGRPLSHLMLILSEVAAQLTYAVGRERGEAAAGDVHRLLSVAINEGINIGLHRLQKEKADMSIR